MNIFIVLIAFLFYSLSQLCLHLSLSLVACSRSHNIVFHSRRCSPLLSFVGRAVRRKEIIKIIIYCLGFFFEFLIFLTMPPVSKVSAQSRGWLILRPLILICTLKELNTHLLCAGVERRMPESLNRFREGFQRSSRP